MTTGLRSTRPRSVMGEVAEQHERLGALLDRAGAPAPPGDPRAAVRALDAALALLCEHLGAVEDVLHPAGVRALPDERRAVAASSSATHAAQRALRTVQQQLWGDTRAGNSSLEELAQELRTVLDLHRSHDEELARRLDGVLGDDERATTAELLAAAVQRAPTRPHPHLPHRGPVASLARRLAGRWDDVLDVMDVRRVEGRRPVPERRPLGLWGSYLLGRPLPPDEEPSPAATSGAGRGAADERSTAASLR